MKRPDTDLRWQGLFETEWLRSLDDAPFLARCRSSTASREELLAFVVQHYHYARNFTRYLVALMANLEREEDRLELASNLFEEMGFGHGPGVPHAELYRDMMSALGVPHEGAAPPASETGELIRTMFECCRARDPMIGLGALCLGAEAIVPYLYSAIVRGFEAIGEPRERLHFFLLHIEEDDAHADTMRRIIVEELRRKPVSRVELEYGARRAIMARGGFFRAIGRSVATRGMEERR
jgi:pyrroloquinoline quinone (PQQ) biosynthesis protein C